MADQSMEPRRIARKQKSRIATAAALAILGSSVTATGASAQAIYVDPYAAVVAPDRGYVVRQTVITPAPIVRERTVVINRPAYVPAPVLPLPRYGYTEERATSLQIGEQAGLNAAASDGCLVSPANNISGLVN